VLIQNLPEGSSLPKLLGCPAAHRYHPTADANRVLWTLYTRGGKIKLHGFRIAVNEIEDSMPSCVHSGDQVRPRNRALRRNAGCQFAKGYMLDQLRKVRHLAGAHEFPEQLRIHAIDTKDDELVIPVPIGTIPPAGNQHCREGQD